MLEDGRKAVPLGVPAYGNIGGIPEDLGGTECFVIHEDSRRLATPGRATLAIDKAEEVLGRVGSTEAPLVIAANLAYLKMASQYEIVVDAIREIFREGELVEPLVFDRTDVTGKKDSLYYLGEVHFERNAIIVRDSQPFIELSRIEDPVPREDGYVYDKIGIFPRFKIGENNLVFAFSERRE